MSATSERNAPGLGGVPETLLIPLWARAREQARPRPLIEDPVAATIVRSLDYDFENFDRRRVAGENFCIRSRLVDDVVSDALGTGRARSVVEFGPGLDTRFHRLGHRARHWVEVDFPEVIALRQRFFEPHARRQEIGRSLLDWNWMNEVGDLGNAPPLFVAEGVLYFLSDIQVRELLCRLADRFPGASVIFDACSPWFLWMSNLWHPLKNSRMQFAVSRNASEFSRWDSRFAVEKYVGYGDAPNYDDLIHQLVWWKRAALRICPEVRHAFKIVQLGLHTDRLAREAA